MDHTLVPKPQSRRTIAGYRRSTVRKRRPQCSSISPFHSPAAPTAATMVRSPGLRRSSQMMIPASTVFPGPVSSAPGRKDTGEAELLAKRLRLAGLDPDPGRQRSLEERRIGRGRAVPAQRIREHGERLRRIEPPVAEPRRPGLVIGNRTISPYNMEAVTVPGWHADSGSTVRARLALAGPLARTRRAGRGIRRLPPRPLAPRRAGRGRGGGRGEDPLGAGRFLQSGYESRCSS